MLAFDLDPGPPADVVDCCRVALRLRELFDHFGIEAFPKTSGSKGLQVYVPLNRKDVSYEETKPFAKAIAQLLEKETPDEVVSKMKKVDRRGKVFVDWSQNHRSKTTVSVYSMRARERPTVSTPVTWDEVEHAAEQRRRRPRSSSRRPTCWSGSRSTATSSPRSSSSNRTCPSSSRPTRPRDSAAERPGEQRRRHEVLAAAVAGIRSPRVVPGQDAEAVFAEAAQPFGGAALGVEVGREGREARVVENVGEVGDVGADHELADPDRLVPGAVAGVLSSSIEPSPSRS